MKRCIDNFCIQLINFWSFIGFCRVKKIVFIGLIFQLSLFSQGVSAGAALKKASDERTMERIVVQAVNEYRAKKGLPPLRVSPIIAHEAKMHSLDMERKRIPFGHLYFGTRIKHIYGKIKYCNGGSENVAWFPPNKSARDVVGLWLTSYGHRRNILGHYNLTGVGIVRDKRGWLYYTQIFIKTDKGSPTK